MVEKKEGAIMECKNCGTELICRLKDYGGGYPPTLQWQNYDGKAHYNTTDGKDFTCNVPEEEDVSQTRIPNPNSPPSATTSGDPPKTGISSAEFSLLVRIDQKLDTTLGDLDRLKDMVAPLFQKMVDDQIRRTSEP